MEFHSLAKLFPQMTGAAFDELVADIHANGLREGIWTHEGKIIDGRNRFLACQRANVAPHYREWDGKGQLIDFVISQNLRRRHLTESQRAMVAAKLATLSAGQRADYAQEAAGEIYTAAPMSAAQAGAALNVSESSVKHAKGIQRAASKAVVDAIEAGEISIHLAEKIVAHPKEEQVAVMAREKLLKGKRQIRTTPDPEVMTTHSDTIKVSLPTDSPEQAALALVAALETKFLEEMASELTAILARRRAAQERGMGPARKD